MKKDQLHKGIGLVQKIVLTPEEKSVILARVNEYADFKPIQETKKKSGHFSLWTWSHKHHFVFRLAVILLLLGAMYGTALAAETSLPGDILYPVKVKVTEPIRTALTIGAGAQAAWEAEKANRRLIEAESLAKQGRLDDSKKQELQDSFETHIHAFNVIEQQVKEHGADLELEAKIDAHSQILGNIETHGDGAERQRVSALQKVIAEKKEEIRVLRSHRESMKKERVDQIGVTGDVQASTTQATSTNIDTSVDVNTSIRKNILENIHEGGASIKDGIWFGKNKDRNRLVD